MMNGRVESCRKDDIYDYRRVCWGYLEHPLSDWDRQFVEKAYESVKYRQLLIYVHPRGSSKWYYDMLQALVILAVGMEQGLIKKR